ncbi:MAG TPA: sulfotransferase [Woeseiaceae bacterium]|nr:sulfotransferase [Woeseiaceae bacterium]
MPDGAISAQQLLQDGKLQEALKAARQELVESPRDVDALYCMAVSQRYLGQQHEALQTLEQVKAVAPNYARAFQEAGHNYKKLGDLDNARLAYKRAVELNRALIASWRELAAIHRQQNNLQLSAAATAEFERLSNLPPELVTVTSLMEESKLYRAEKLCRDFLQKSPHHIEAMRLLALLGMKLLIYDDAEFLLESCVELAPDYWLARLDYVTVLHKRQKFKKALEQAVILRDMFPGNYVFDLTFANQSVAIGNFESALEIYDKVIAAHPGFGQTFLARGHALKTVGRVDEGIESYRAAYRVRADFGDAYWSLANLKTYRFTDEEITLMRTQIERPETAADDRFHLCFALGKGLEDRGQYEESFACYVKGNELRRSGLRYDPERLPLAMQRQMEICTQRLFEEKTGVGGDYRDPIFIVGLPRAGSTLLEQILASHSEIDGTMELPNIIATAHRLDGRRLVSQEANYPAILTQLTAEHFQKLADTYIKDTAIHRQGAPHFVDKMPNNFMHIGLIHLMFPNAKVIDARRHPMACCFSGFKQLFADGQEFTYGIDDIVAYYRSYVSLMAHWDAVLPGKVLRVHYEHVVNDAESQVRRMLEFLGVPFEPACLSFYQTDRSVRTPSSEQVRQPIYRRGLEHWRNFEPYLDAMKTGLADEIANYPA